MSRSVLVVKEYVVPVVVPVVSVRVEVSEIDVAEVVEV